MTKNVNALITKFSEQPKKLFLIDGFGALVTAILIGVVLTQLSSLMGLLKIIISISGNCYPVCFVFLFLLCVFEAGKTGIFKNYRICQFIVLRINVTHPAH